MDQMEDCQISELYDDCLAFAIDHVHQRLGMVTLKHKNVCELISLNKNSEFHFKLKFDIKEVVCIKFSSLGDFVAGLSKYFLRFLLVWGNGGFGVGD